jgi:hypothetical protein
MIDPPRLLVHSRSHSMPHIREQGSPDLKCMWNTFNEIALCIPAMLLGKTLLRRGTKIVYQICPQAFYGVLQ